VSKQGEGAAWHTIPPRILHVVLEHTATAARYSLNLAMRCDPCHIVPPKPKEQIPRPVSPKSMGIVPGEVKIDKVSSASHGWP